MSVRLIVYDRHGPRTETLSVTSATLTVTAGLTVSTLKAELPAPLPDEASVDWGFCRLLVPDSSEADGRGESSLFEIFRIVEDQYGEGRTVHGRQLSTAISGTVLRDFAYQLEYTIGVVRPYSWWRDWIGSNPPNDQDTLATLLLGESRQFSLHQGEMAQRLHRLGIVSTAHVSSGGTTQYQWWSLFVPTHQTSIEVTGIIGDVKRTYTRGGPRRYSSPRDGDVRYKVASSVAGQVRDYSILRALHGSDHDLPEVYSRRYSADVFAHAYTFQAALAESQLLTVRIPYTRILPFDAEIYAGDITIRPDKATYTFAESGHTVEIEGYERPAIWRQLSKVPHAGALPRWWEFQPDPVATPDMPPDPPPDISVGGYRFHLVPSPKQATLPVTGFVQDVPRGMSEPVEFRMELRNVEGDILPNSQVFKAVVTGEAPDLGGGGVAGSLSKMTISPAEFTLEIPLLTGVSNVQLVTFSVTASTAGKAHQAIEFGFGILFALMTAGTSLPALGALGKGQFLLARLLAGVANATGYRAALRFFVLEQAYIGTTLFQSFAVSVRFGPAAAAMGALNLISQVTFVDAYPVRFVGKLDDPSQVIVNPDPAYRGGPGATTVTVAPFEIVFDARYVVPSVARIDTNQQAPIIVTVGPTVSRLSFDTSLGLGPSDVSLEIVDPLADTDAFETIVFEDGLTLGLAPASAIREGTTPGADASNPLLMLIQASSAGRLTLTNHRPGDQPDLDKLHTFPIDVGPPRVQVFPAPLLRIPFVRQAENASQHQPARFRVARRESPDPCTYTITQTDAYPPNGRSRTDFSFPSSIAFQAVPAGSVAIHTVDIGLTFSSYPVSMAKFKLTPSLASEPTLYIVVVATQEDNTRWHLLPQILSYPDTLDVGQDYDVVIRRFGYRPVTLTIEGDANYDEVTGESVRLLDGANEVDELVLPALNMETVGLTLNETTVQVRAKAAGVSILKAEQFGGFQVLRSDLGVHEVALLVPAAASNPPPTMAPDPSTLSFVADVAQMVTLTYAGSEEVLILGTWVQFSTTQAGTYSYDLKVVGGADVWIKPDLKRSDYSVTLVNPQAQGDNTVYDLKVS